MRKGPLLGPTVPLWLLLLGVTAAIPFADALAADKTAPPSAAGTYVIVARAVQGCFFDTVRVSGYLMPRQEMQIPFEAEGYRITEVSVGTGDKVTVGQQLGRVRISVDQNSGLCFGAFAKASIDATRRCGVSVPRSAVAYGSGGTSVQVVRDRIVESHNVRVGLTSDKDAEILDGVKQGDLVVAHAGTSLRDGEKVTTIFADEFGQTSLR
jgi:multidrug efflux pump subunit AcrA (membrane-fusion protein)